MAKIWANTKQGIRDFERSLSKGKTVYAISEHSTKIAAQFETHTYSAWTCTGRHAITGAMMFGTVSAKTLLCGSADGRVYETPPPGIRNLASPEPDCRDEGLYGIGRGQEFKGNIQDGEKEMRRLGWAARDRAKADQKSGARKGWW